MPFPGYAQVGGEIEDLAFLCRGAAIPAMTVTNINVNFRGRAVKIAGDREIPNWTITVLNDTNFKLRNAFERWQNGINNMTDNEGLTNPVDYQVDAFVDHLDRNGNTIKSYTLRGAYPVSLSEIALDFDEKTEVEHFTFGGSYQYWSAITPNFFSLSFLFEPLFLVPYK